MADLFNADPAGVVLGADRAVLLSSLAEASSSRAGLGYEVIVSRLDDEANIAPWLRAAHRYGAKVKWAEVDIETGDLPTWQWESLIGKSTRLVAVTSASGTLGTVTDLRAMTKLVHDVGGLVVVDHSAAAPYRLLDIKDTDVDVVAVNALAWGGPPIGAIVFRDPALINTFSSVSTDPHATGPARLEVGVHQFGLLAGVVASIEYLAALDESARGSRRERLSLSMQSAASYLNRIFDYLMVSLRSLPLVMVIGRPGDADTRGQFRARPGARRAGGTAVGGQRNSGDFQREFARAGRAGRQRRRRRRHRRAGALLDDGRGRPVGARAGVVGLSMRRRVRTRHSDRLLDGQHDLSGHLARHQQSGAPRPACWMGMRAPMIGRTRPSAIIGHTEAVTACDDLALAVRAAHRPAAQRGADDPRPFAEQLADVEFALHPALHADDDQLPVGGQGVDIAVQIGRRP